MHGSYQKIKGIAILKLLYFFLMLLRIADLQTNPNLHRKTLSSHFVGKKQIISQGADVYKRQHPAWTDKRYPGEFTILAVRDANAVSYTHLDVYKRQGRNNTALKYAFQCPTAENKANTARIGFDSGIIIFHNT